MIPQTDYKALVRKAHKQPANATVCVKAHLIKE